MQTPDKMEVSKLRIETLIDTVFKFIGIIIFAKGLLDWYIDYRIDKKIKKIKTVALPAKISDVNLYK